MNWTPEIVRARFVEAAATEAFLPKDYPSVASGYWPAYQYDADDRKGWDDQATLDNAARWKGRASSGAITRHQQCMEWTTSRLDDPTRRRLLWGFSFCRANKWDFGKMCDRNGWKRSTAYNRLNRIWEQLAEQFNNEGRMLELPAQDWIGHECPENASIDAKMAVADEPSNSAIPNAPFRTEKHLDLIKTVQDVEQFQKHLERINARRRKLQQWREEARMEIEGAA